eukprot:TRINITY_DN6559_c0_g1_i1.p1 TRINITY_DN6559_c0_g1~~TRINITY_DN6559_c0_g1_i1.p1  ORF type:complete len:586 (+),score=124.68 TRINITY_DN6559_c0_g1_i1:168-1925(+)
MDLSSFFCCAEIEKACSQFELHTDGGVPIRKPSELVQQLHYSATRTQKPKTHLEDVEEEHYAGLLSPPRSRRPMPGLRVRCASGSDSDPAKNAKVTGPASARRVGEVGNLAEIHGVNDPCRETDTSGADSRSVENTEEVLIQDATPSGHSAGLEEACSHALLANMDADVLEAGWQVAREQPCGESQDHELEAPELRNADQCIGASALDGIAHAKGGTLRERCISGLSSASKSEQLEEWYIGDASADAASDHGNEGTLSDTVLSHAALGQELLLEVQASSDEHPGVCADADVAAGRACQPLAKKSASDCGKALELVNNKSEEMSAVEPTRTLSARCRSKDRVAADEGVLYTCGELESDYTALDNLLKDQAADESTPAGFAAYYWKEGPCQPLAQKSASGCGKALELVDNKLEEKPAVEPAHGLSARCRSKDRVAADEGVSHTCGQLEADYTALDNMLKDQAADESAHAGFAAYYWKDGIAEREISGSQNGLDDASDADRQAGGIAREFSEVQASLVSLPEDAESEEEVAHDAFILPMMEVLRCAPTRNFGALLRLWDARCSSQQTARAAEDNPQIFKNKSSELPEG